jgi:hypothetical protein
MTKTVAIGGSGSLIFLLVLTSLVATSFLFSAGTTDVGMFEKWMDEISGYGLVGGYVHSGTDYPPLSFVLLAAVIRFAAMFGATHLLVLKWLLLLFLFATSTCFYLFTRSVILTAALELSLILNSVGLGYLDICFAPFLIAALFYLERGKLNRGLCLFAISCCIKWQPLIIAPFVCLHVLRTARTERAGLKKFLRQSAPFLISAFAIATPLLVIFGTAIVAALQRAMTDDWLSGYALNVGWLHTWLLHLLRSDKYGALSQGVVETLKADASAKWLEKILFYASYALVFFLFVRRPATFRRLIAYSVLGYLSYFIFNIGVHENHLFLVCCLAWILVFFERDWLIRCVNLAIMANANLFLFYGCFGRRLYPVVAGIDITILFAIANVFLFAELALHTFKRDGFDLWFVKPQPTPLSSG